MFYFRYSSQITGFKNFSKKQIRNDQQTLTGEFLNLQSRYRGSTLGVKNERKQILIYSIDV